MAWEVARGSGARPQGAQVLCVRHSSLLASTSLQSWPRPLLSNGLPWWLNGKESSCQCRRFGFDPWWEDQEDTQEKEMATHSGILA